MSLPPNRFCSIILGWGIRRITAGGGHEAEMRLAQWYQQLDEPLPGEMAQLLARDEDLEADGESFMQMYQNG